MTGQRVSKIQDSDEEGKFTYKNRGGNSIHNDYNEKDNTDQVLFKDQVEFDEYLKSDKEKITNNFDFNSDSLNTVDKINFVREILEEKIEEYEKQLVNKVANGVEQLPTFVKIPIYEQAIELINNKSIYKTLKKSQGTEATENLLMSKKDSYLNTDYAKEHLIYNNYTELDNDFKDYFKEKIKTQIGEDKLNSTKGIFINSEHLSSKDLSKVIVQNEDFKKLFNENNNKMQKGLITEGSINFTDKNFHNALGNVDIKEMKYKKNGDLELYVTDVYDFNKNDNNPMVKAGRRLQDRGEIKPYFIIYHVIIPKNEIREIRKCSEKM